MERDNMSLVTEDLSNNLDENMQNIDYTKDSVGDDYYHRIKVFKKMEEYQLVLMDYQLLYMIQITLHYYMDINLLLKL